MDVKETQEPLNSHFIFRHATSAWNFYARARKGRIYYDGKL